MADANKSLDDLEPKDRHADDGFDFMYAFWAIFFVLLLMAH